MGGREAPIVLKVRDLVKNFESRSTLGRRSTAVVQAVSGVSFDIRQGETFSIVGESGCGKSTTARCVTRLLEPTSGSIEMNGTEISKSSLKELVPLRSQFQMVFQDPQASLNPRQRVRDIIGEPLLIRGDDRSAIEQRVNELALQVRLRTEDLDRYPFQFSGGQRQRIGIARALALNPNLIALDEPVSALDVSIQAEIIRLLKQLKDDMGLAYLLIAHDLAVVRHVSDYVGVMYLGKIVESGSNAEVYESPLHPYSQALLSAAPIPDPDLERARRRIILSGDVPSPLDPPSGCRFRTRCWKADEQCSSVEPALVDVGGGHKVACHYPEERSVFVRSSK